MKSGGILWGACLLILVGLLAGREVHAQQLLPIAPERLSLEEPPPDIQRRDMVCYHAGAYYYVKIPHPVWGNVGRQYQRLTPVSGGLLEGCEIRLHNNWDLANTHNGTLWLGVHRQVNQLPGVPEMLYPVATDSLDAGIYYFYLPQPGFTLLPDEEVFLSLSFTPATPADSIAIVTAAAGTWTGHSFFLQNNQVSWWGTEDNVPFGDMHFCGEIDFVDGPQAQPWMPWTQANLGLVPAGTSKSWRFPIHNIGPAPLVVSLQEQHNERFTAMLEGPDSLAHPDTLFLELDYHSPGAWLGDVMDSTSYRLSTNCPDDSLLHMSLTAGSSTSEILLSDWNEWANPNTDWYLTFTQFADTGATASNWDFYTGLWRPGTFVGHEAPTPGSTSTNILALRNLWVEEGEYVRLRWSQYRRPGTGEEAQRGFVWRNPQTNFWYVQNDYPLNEQPWAGPEGEWYTVPWILWGPCPSTGAHGFGLLFSGTSGGDWFVDDLEVNRQPELVPPTIHISISGPDIRLDWNSVVGAQSYLISQVQNGQETLLGETDTPGWVHSRGLHCIGYCGYRVRTVGSANDPSSGRNLTPLSAPLRSVMPPQHPTQLPNASR